VKKRNDYLRTRFSSEVLREAIEKFRTLPYASAGPLHNNCTRAVRVADGTWTHDSDEEFFADYRRGSGEFSYHEQRGKQLFGGINLEVICPSLASFVRVTVKAQTRADIEGVFEIFEKHAQSSRIAAAPAPPPPPPKVFIGHGGSTLWRDLKDQLHEKHGYDIEAFEVGARAGHGIRDVLESMLTKSNFAILVMTGEDETAEGGMRARQNVVHEAGLFQGRLGFHRAIVLLEDGTEAFSNIDGIQQIRFEKGKIALTFGEVLATLRREFGLA
jgi:predicted nucleotide-binding protein